MMDPGSTCAKKLGDGSVFACALPLHLASRVHLSAETIEALSRVGGRYPQPLTVDQLQHRARLAVLGLLVPRESK